MQIETIGNCVLVNGDCEEFIKQLPDNSINLIHTDPPYIIHSSGNIGSFMESGTTGEACLRQNRKFIGIEKNKDFFDMAVTRIRKVYDEIIKQ